MSEPASRGSSKLVYRSPSIGSGVAWCSFNSRRTFALSVPINKSTESTNHTNRFSYAAKVRPAPSCSARPGLAPRACQTKTSKL